MFIYKKFLADEDASYYAEIKESFNLPERLINEIIGNLIELNFIYLLDGDERESHYTPARNPDVLTVQDILEGIRSHGASAMIEKKNDEIHSIVETLENEYIELLSQSFATQSVKELLEGTKQTAPM